LDEAEKTGVLVEQFRIIRPDGSIRWVEARGFPVRDAQGKVYRLAGIVQDVTERKQAEQALRESEERLRLAAQAGRMYAFEWDVTTGLLVRSSEYANVLGATEPRTLTQQQVMARIHPDDRATVVAAVARHSRENPTVDVTYRVLLPGKSLVWVRSSGRAFFDGRGRMTRVIGMVADVTEQKLAEEALRESEDRYRDLVEHSQDLLCTHDLEGNLLSCNPAPARILGYEVAELLRVPMRELIAPEFREHFDQYLERIKAKGEDRGLMAVIGRGGERRIWEYHNTLRIEGVPSPIVRGMAHDITERKHAEMALRRSEEDYRMFVAQSSEAIFRQDLDTPVPIDLPEDELIHRILYDSHLANCNDALARLYGSNSAREFIGKRLTESVDPTDLRNIELTREYIRSGFRVLERESHEVDVHGNPKIFLNSMIGIVENGKLVRTWGIQRDITERVKSEEARRKAEAALRESEAHFRILVEQASDAIGITDVNDRWFDVNSAWQALLGYTREEILRQKVGDNIVAEDRPRVMGELSRLQGGGTLRSEFTVQRQDGRVFPVEASARRLPDGRLQVIARDITERRQAEQALQKAHDELARVTRIATLGELTASIAHEINQPLGAVITNGSAALRWLEANPPNLTEAREAMAQSIEQADLASEVIKRTRLMLQKSPPESQPLGINDIIREALALSSNELLRGGVMVHTEFAADLPAVLGDRVQLQQVMLNLILNAIEAMSTVSGRPRVLSIKSARQGQDVEIHVQDSGIGLRPEELERIFDPFVTTKAEGIGMGLSISRSIVAAHGGRLWATSGVPHGARFQFWLPAQRASDERVA